MALEGSYLFDKPWLLRAPEQIENGRATVEHGFTFQMHTLSNYICPRTSSKLSRTNTPD
jgi:hypothetical protein